MRLHVVNANDVGGRAEEVYERPRVLVIFNFLILFRYLSSTHCARWPCVLADFCCFCPTCQQLLLFGREELRHATRSPVGADFAGAVKE